MQQSQSLIKPLNLLPIEIVREQRRSKIMLQAGCFFLILAGFLFLVGGHLQRTVDCLEKDLANIQPLTLQTRALANEGRNRKAQLIHEENRESLLRDQTGIDPADDLIQIEAVVPPGVELIRINLSTDKLSISGHAAKPQDIALLLLELQREFGLNIRLSACHLREDAEYHFQIEGAVARQ